MLPTLNISTNSARALPAASKIQTGKDEGGAAFNSVLHKECSSTGKSCLGGSRPAKGGLLKAKGGLSNAKAVQEKGFGARDLRSLLAALKKEMAGADESGAGLVLDHPDEQVLTEFLQACGFKEGEIARIKQQMQEGKDGEYSLSILFAVLSDPSRKIDSPPLSDPSLPAVPDSLSPSDLAVIDNMLEEVGVTPGEITDLTTKLPSQNGMVKVASLADALKDAAKGPVRSVPPEEGHKAKLAELLGRLGLNDDEVKSCQDEAGLGSQGFSLKQLAAVLEKAADMVDRKKNPVDGEKLFGNIEDLLAKVKVKSSGSPDASALHARDTNWIDRIREGWAKNDPVQQSVSAFAAVEQEPANERASAFQPKDVSDYLFSGRDAETAVAQKPLWALNEPASTTALKNTYGPVYRAGDTVFPQIMDQVLGSVRVRDDKVVVRLFPPHLGEVKVDMVFKDDQLNTTFTIDNHKVKEIVEGSLATLRTALLDQGIKMGECNVELNQDYKPFFKGQEGDHGRRPNWTAGTDGGTEDVWPQNGMESLIMATRGSPQSGLDLFA